MRVDGCSGHSNRQACLHNSVAAPGVYICGCACTYVRVHMCVYTYGCEHMFVCVHVYVCVHLCVCNRVEMAAFGGRNSTAAQRRIRKCVAGLRAVLSLPLLLLP